MPGPGDPPKEYRFTKQNPRPGPGRPKGSSLTAILRRELEKATKDGKTVGEAVMNALIGKALKGNYVYIKEILDRIEGKPKERHEIELSDAEAEAAHAKALMKVWNLAEYQRKQGGKPDAGSGPAKTSR